MKEFEKCWARVLLTTFQNEIAQDKHFAKVFWKEAVQWMLTELETEEPFEVFIARIKEELKDEA